MSDRTVQRSGIGPVGARELVLGAAALLILAQLALRAWALYPSWFYLDDLQMLDEAGKGLDARLLFEPYDSQFMPLGRLLAWVVSTNGLVSWGLAATLTLAVQLAASVACLWMLSTLHGMRWEILVPLSLYLFTAITVPATMWWAASLNALPLQVAFFCAVATWWRYLRTRRWRWLALTLLVLGLGLLAYVKALVLFPLLALLALAYFGEGSLRNRFRVVARRYWPAVGAGVALAAAFSAYYLSQVPQLTTDSPAPVAGPLADTMLGTALPVGLLGGPWRWSEINPPAGLADPYGWATGLSWVAIAALVAYLGMHRRRTGRVWLLLAYYVLASYLLLLVTRAPVVGSVAGLEYRYLADVACAVALCVGLLLLPALGTDQGTEPRPDPVLRWRLPQRYAAAGVALVLLGGVLSTVGYARIWHTDNPGERFLRSAQEGLRDAGPVAFADTVVPDNVIPGYLYPFNTSVRLLPVVTENAYFPRVTGQLAVLGEDGEPRRAVISPAASAQPGPKEGCGWLVQTDPVLIPLDTRVFDYTWWVRVGYLASADTTVEVRIGSNVVEAPVRRGAHELFVNVTDDFGVVTLGGLPAGQTMCVDTVDVGTATPGGPL
ncbi:hypothetical protein [Nocardioides pantholopis]|uniref:hypothetical protein n=1 Tax=Nocardioides pantholopis TaxID=2483798 RepID=UPI0013DD9DC8|nr:hypothetical protein [Nocardioides pantholopis]